MSRLLKYREKLRLTQEQLSEKSNISVRTIQRIEAGKELKGHTLDALAQALGIDRELLIETESEQKEINFPLVKLINLSSILLVFLPLGNIVLPLGIMYWKKEINPITRQIVSIQIMWTILFPIVVLAVILIRNLIPMSKQVVPITMLLLLLADVYVILRNHAELDKKKKLYINLNFSII